MGKDKNTSFEKQKTQNNIFEDFDYEKIDVDFGKKEELVDIYEKKGFLKKYKLNKWQFGDFLEIFFKDENKYFQKILKTKYEKNKFYFTFKDGTNTSISYKKLENFLIENSLEGEKKEDIEKKANNINHAIEAIYKNNEGFIFDGEINNEDIITDSLIKKYSLDKKYLNKNLKQLKVLLDIENQKLFKVYDVTGESHKKQELLKKEIVFYTGIGNKYEGGAFYFGLNSEEIGLKVQELLNTMNISEIFNYIKNINKEIDGNLRRSDMVDQVNLKLTSALYDYTFDRLKNEDSPNKDFIKFIKLITGRGKLEIDFNKNYKEKQEFEYDEIDVDEIFKGQNIANKALIYIMYKDGGLLEEIREKQKKEIKLEDEEMVGKTPNGVLNEAKTFFNNSVDNKIEGYGEEILKSLDFTKELDKPYKELNFDEKVSIGSLSRLLKKLKELNPGEIKNSTKLKEISGEMVKQSFEELNESFSDNFNESLFDWDGTSAEDLGLKGTSAEIFELYQDINGNKGLFDWKDTNKLGLGAIAMGITMAAGIYIIAPLLIGGIGIQALAIAGAKLGLVDFLSGQIFSRKGFDTYGEGAKNIGTDFLIKEGTNIASIVGGIGLLQKFGKTVNPDLLFSKSAWLTKEGLFDKSVIGMEALTVSYLSSIASNNIKKEYIEYHKDTDKKRN